MGASNGPYIMTLVNSIIGVSILAMPFCYKQVRNPCLMNAVQFQFPTSYHRSCCFQCGILLATVILVFSNLMTRLSCHYLVKSAIMTRRRSYELLGKHRNVVFYIDASSASINSCYVFFVCDSDDSFSRSRRLWENRCRVKYHFTYDRHVYRFFRRYGRPRTRDYWSCTSSGILCRVTSSSSYR